jgi:hypothetical protein
VLSDSILESAATIANQWRALAATWHLAIAALVVLVWRRRVDARAMAALLSLLPFSVAAMAAWSGNPFNTAVFVALGLVMLALAGTTIPARVAVARGWDAAAGVTLCAFGWVYPHFLDGPAWQYAYAAPLGLLPCPTLAFLLGVSQLRRNFDSKIWAILIGSVGLFYGVIGVFVLDVTIVWFLIAGAAALLAREKRLYEIPFLRFGSRPGV